MVYLCAKPGDIVDVRIGDVHPTQPSLGYDEVYYKLGRYTLGKDTINKKFATGARPPGCSMPLRRSPMRAWMIQAASPAHCSQGKRRRRRGR